MDRTLTAANVEIYIDLLKQSSTLYKLQNLGLDLNTAQTMEDAQAILDRAFALQINRSGVQSMTMEQGFEQFLDRHDGEAKPDYVSWGVPVMDEHLFVEAGDMVVLGGYPSDGKTALALQFGAGIGRKHRVGFFSYESKKEKLFDRYIASGAMLSYTSIKRNTLREADYEELLQLHDKLTEPQMTLVDASGMTVLDLQAYSQAHHFDVVFVDYLQKCAAPSGSKHWSEFDRVSAISSNLQQFGRITNTVIIALSQLSRPDRDKRDGKIRPPVLSDLRSSGQIEQDADVVMLLSREDYDSKDSNRRLTFAKNKEGEAFDYVRFKFDGDLQTFSRIAPGPEPVAQKPKRVKQPTLFDTNFRLLEGDPVADKVFPPEEG
jgi:replicative DNA helicase